MAERVEERGCADRVAGFIGGAVLGGIIGLVAMVVPVLFGAAVVDIAIKRDSVIVGLVGLALMNLPILLGPLIGGTVGAMYGLAPFERMYEAYMRWHERGHERDDGSPPMREFVGAAALPYGCMLLGNLVLGLIGIGLAWVTGYEIIAVAMAKAGSTIGFFLGMVAGIRTILYRTPREKRVERQAEESPKGSDP